MRIERPAPDPLGDADLDAATAREIVAEAFHTFGEETARALACHLQVGFEACAEAILRLGHLHG